ncbi:MAG: hypothetical protein ACRELX_03080 [Longimicrobiales bacterium]
MTLHRRLATLSLVLALPFAVVACDTAGDVAEDAQDAVDETGTPAATPAPVTPPAAPDMEAIVAPATALNDSGVMGEVTIDDDGETQSTVMVTLTGSAAGAVHQGMIHAGTCDNIGEVVSPLDPITIGDEGEGEVTTTVPVPLMTVSDGTHVVAYHEANGTPGAPITCAAIPMHAM